MECAIPAATGTTCPTGSWVCGRSTTRVLASLDHATRGFDRFHSADPRSTHNRDNLGILVWGATENPRSGVD
jgi:hypothetical protein